MVGFVLGHQPVRIDPAANNNNNSTLIGRRLNPSSSAAMIPETTTLHGGGGGDADGRPMVIGEGPQHRHKNKQAREFEFVFGCEFPSIFLLTILGDLTLVRHTCIGSLNENLNWVNQNG